MITIRMAYIAFRVFHSLASRLLCGNEVCAQEMIFASLVQDFYTGLSVYQYLNLIVSMEN